MAKQQQVIYSYTCDICGNEIPEGTSTPNRRFSYEGKDYEVDLCEKDQRGLDKALTGLTAYTGAGRRVAGGATPRRSRRPSAGPSRRRSTGVKSVRDWARANGWPDLGTRGRIPAAAQKAYEAATR